MKKNLFEEALAEGFSKTNKGLVSLLAEFSGANTETVKTWLSNQVLPKGEYALKAMYFLEITGYAPVLSDNPDVKRFGYSLALGIITPPAAQNVTGYVKLSSLYAVLRGEVGITINRREAMAMFNTEHEEQVTSRIAYWKQRLVSTGLVNQEEELLPDSNSDKTNDKLLVVNCLGSLLSAILPLAQLVASDRFSAEDREKVRESAGRSTVLFLTNALVQLSGERARASSLSRSNL